MESAGYRWRAKGRQGDGVFVLVWNDALFMCSLIVCCFTGKCYGTLKNGGNIFEKN